MNKLVRTAIWLPLSLVRQSSSMKSLAQQVTTDRNDQTDCFSSLHSLSSSQADSSFSSSSNTVQSEEHLLDSDQLSTVNAEKAKFFDYVNQLIEQGQSQRHFAVVHLYGKQIFVREGDLFKVDRQVPAQLGERIKLEKCLLAGSDEYTLVGRPLLDRNQVHIEATVTEITQSHSINRHIFTQRQQGHRRWRFHRHPITILRVNAIQIKHGISQNPKELFN